MKYDLNIRYLEYFTKTAKLGSINKAAQALYISQPYLGKIMQELETTLGIRLFNRSRSGVSLTPEGEAFLTKAEIILKEIDGIWFQKKDEVQQTVQLSVAMTRFSHIMESFAEIVLRHKDQTSFSHCLYEGNYDQVIEDVASGKAGIGVFHFDSRKRKLTEETLEAKGLEYHFITNVEPHVVISKKHPLLMQNKPVNMKTLSDYGFLWYLGEGDDYIYDLLDMGDYDSKKEKTRITYLESRATVMYMISISDCYTIGIHGFERQEGAYQSTSISIANSGFMLQFGYAVKKGTQLSDIEKEFIRDLTRRLR